MPKFKVFPLLLTVLLASCDESPSVQSGPDMEVTRNPRILTDPTCMTGGMTFRHLKIGDSYKQVTGGEWDPQWDTGGEPYFVGGDRQGVFFRQGYVVGFKASLDNTNILKPLDIRTRYDIEARFGKADRVVECLGLPKGFLSSSDVEGWSYHYDRRGFCVTWTADKGLTALYIADSTVHEEMGNR